MIEHKVLTDKLFWDCIETIIWKYLVCFDKWAYFDPKNNKNRFGELSNELDTATDEHQHLIQANNEAAQEHLQTQRRKQKKQLGEDPLW